MLLTGLWKSHTLFLYLLKIPALSADSLFHGAGSLMVFSLPLLYLFHFLNSLNTVNWNKQKMTLKLVQNAESIDLEVFLLSDLPYSIDLLVSQKLLKKARNLCRKKTLQEKKDWTWNNLPALD